MSSDCRDNKMNRYRIFVTCLHELITFLLALCEWIVRLLKLFNAAELWFTFVKAWDDSVMLPFKIVIAGLPCLWEWGQ